MNTQEPEKTIESNEKKYISMITYAGFLTVSVIFMLLFSLWTSPVYKHWYGCDASFFTLTGRGMLNGMIPYRDFYDLKGPYFFFIQALGQLICYGRTGIFIVQVISLFLSLVLIYRTGRLFISHKKSLGIAAFFLWPYISMLWGGNIPEEFILPLNLLGIYLNLRLFSGLYPANDTTIIGNNSGYTLNISALITGLCFCIMTFSKITAGAPLIGLIIGVFILCLFRRGFKPLAFYAIYFILGFLIALLPLLIFYGYHGYILKMLYCTFIFGFKRSSDLSNALSLNLEVKLSGVIFSMVFILLHTFSFKKDEHEREFRIDKTYSILLFPMCLVTWLALHLGDSFIYYFITELPCLIVTLILFVKIYDPLILFKTVRQSVCWLLLFIFVFHFTKDSLGTIDTFIHRNNDTFHKDYYTNSLNMGTLIPDYDRGSVFSFDIDMQWYEINKILPCNKYVINLQYFIALEPSIEQELFEFFEQTPPKWMICSNTLKDYLPQMYEIIDSRYDCLYTTDVGVVYLLRE